MGAESECENDFTQGKVSMISSAYGKVSGEKLARALGLEVFIKSYIGHRPLGNMKPSSSLKRMEVNLYSAKHNVLFMGEGVGARATECRERAIHDALKHIVTIFVEVAMQSSKTEIRRLTPKQIGDRAWNVYLDRRDNSPKLTSGDDNE